LQSHSAFRVLYFFWGEGFANYFASHVSLVYIDRMASFFVAMAWICFAQSSLLTRVLTGLSFSIVVLLTAAVVSVEYWPTTDSEQTLWQRLLGKIRSGLIAERTLFKSLRYMTRDRGLVRENGPQGSRIVGRDVELHNSVA